MYLEKVNKTLTLSHCHENRFCNLSRSFGSRGVSSKSPVQLSNSLYLLVREKLTLIALCFSLLSKG